MPGVAAEWISNCFKSTEKLQTCEELQLCLVQANANTLHICWLFFLCAQTPAPYPRPHGN